MREVLLGIDFGTTNTVITYFDNNKVNILKDTIFETIPSKICFVDDKVYCGNYIPINIPNISNNTLKERNNIDDSDIIKLSRSYLDEGKKSMCNNCWHCLC
jgi:molecular chaperone DnaK (HSP70)